MASPESPPAPKKKRKKNPQKRRVIAAVSLIGLLFVASAAVMAVLFVTQSKDYTITTPGLLGNRINLTEDFKTAKAEDTLSQALEETLQKAEEKEQAEKKEAEERKILAEQEKAKNTAPSAQEKENAKTADYVLPTSNTAYLTDQDLSALSAAQLRIARNEIYARHGYIFKDTELQKYFSTKSWYTPVSNNIPDSQFNAYERANRDLIVSIENQMAGTDGNITQTRQCYAEALKEMISTEKWPDGKNIERLEDTEWEENQFAIMDVDQDGKEELWISITSSSMPGMEERVFGLDEEKGILYVELDHVFPGASYYENGLILANDSHNHTAGHLHPYSIYKYNTESSTYECIAWVSSWDKNYRLEYGGEKFPDELDTDGDGILYGAYMESTDETKIMNQDEYDAWYHSYFGNTRKLEIPFQAITVENIEKYSSE